MQKGLVHIYTGGGKGKTTAAAGLALRAKGRGMKVLFAVFMKEEPSGECASLERLSVSLLRFEGVLSPFFHPGADKESLRLEALDALERLNAIFSEEAPDMAVLDEFVCLVSEGLITEEEAVEFINERPAAMEIVLTGRGATEGLIGLADYVTEMKEMKHPYSKGVKSREGIEF